MSVDPDQDTARFERDFATAMSAAGGRFGTDHHPLIEGARARGRTLRRRRRAGLVTAGAALGLLTGAVLGQAAGHGGATAAHPAAARPLTGKEVLATLVALLPPGGTQVAEARGTASGTPQVRLVLDDGHGPAQVLFWITTGLVAERPGCPDPVQPAGDRCTAATRADGSTVVIYQAATRSDEPAGAKTWSAKLYRPDGRVMMLQEWNRRPLERGEAVTRLDPPLTEAQLTALVTDPSWDKVAAAVGPVDPFAAGGDGDLGDPRGGSGGDPIEIERVPDAGTAAGGPGTPPARP
ncbi:hypothetical protein AB0K43_16360 [Kitasatospora sp. NPDC049258]|uniref:hypothetical protein n=1 Tax=Kitasatospora sp. NPDC049258 TaxID=3155394 RepID=UPI0034193DE5